MLEANTLLCTCWNNFLCCFPPLLGEGRTFLAMQRKTRGRRSAAFFQPPWKSTTFCIWRTSLAGAGQTHRMLHMLQLWIDKVVKTVEMGETKRPWRRAPITPFCTDKTVKPTDRQLHSFSLDLCSSWDQLPGMNYAANSRTGSVMLSPEPEPCWVLFTSAELSQHQTRVPGTVGCFGNFPPFVLNWEIALKKSDSQNQNLGSDRTEVIHGEKRIITCDPLIKVWLAACECREQI